jgi:hypothetical protein
LSVPRIRDGLRHSVLVFLGARVGASILSLVAVGLISPRIDPAPPQVAGWPIAPITMGWHNLFTAFERQDAARFLSIATHGYAVGDGSAAFFPLYPMAIHAVAWLPGIGPLAAAIIVSNLALLGALVMLNALARLEGMSEATANRATLFLAIFPTAFFFLAPYSEALFLFLSIAAFWLARRNRWAFAALLGALAALTRSFGILLVPALMVEAIHQSRRARSLLPRLGAAAAIGLGPFAYFWYWKVRFGDFWAPLHAQQGWGRVLTNPAATLWHGVVSANRFGSYWLVDLVIVCAILIPVLIGTWSLRPTYAIYSVAGLLLPLVEPMPDRPLMSMPRFVVVLFPAFWVLAKAGDKTGTEAGGKGEAGLRLPESLVTASFAIGYGLLLLLFVNWWYIF